MIFFFEVPAFLILVLILCCVCGVMAIAGNIAYILFVIAQIILIIIGIVVLCKTISSITKTGRIYLIIPALSFLVFTVLGLYLLYSFFCMSEGYSYTEQINYMGKTITYTLQKNTVRLYALLISIASAVVFSLLLPKAFSGKIGRSIFVCVLCLALLIVPIGLVYHLSNQQYYEKHSQNPTECKVLSENINLIWKEINYSEYRFPYTHMSWSNLPILCSISAGTEVYLTGNTDEMDGENYCEIFIPGKSVIGLVKAEYLR